MLTLVHAYKAPRASDGGLQGGMDLCVPKT